MFAVITLKIHYSEMWLKVITLNFNSFNSTEKNASLIYQFSCDMRAKDGRAPVFKREGAGNGQVTCEGQVSSRLGRGRHFVSLPEGFSKPWATCSLRSGSLTWHLHHRYCLRSQRKGMRIWWLHSYHGNQRCFHYWPLQTKIQGKHRLSYDGKRKDEGTWCQGLVVFKK